MAIAPLFMVVDSLEAGILAAPQGPVLHRAAHRPVTDAYRLRPPIIWAGLTPRVQTS